MPRPIYHQCGLDDVALNTDINALSPFGGLLHRFLD